MTPDTQKQHTFTLTIKYLKDIVAKQTFRDSPAAALRELIQNAHDACLVRSARYGDEQLSVQVTLDPTERTIIIEDSGIGMSLSDIHKYLTTVGSSGKSAGETRDEYSTTIRNRKRLENIIGEFGWVHRGVHHRRRRRGADTVGRTRREGRPMPILK